MLKSTLLALSVIIYCLKIFGVPNGNICLLSRISCKVFTSGMNLIMKNALSNNSVKALLIISDANIQMTIEQMNVDECILLL